MVALTLPDGSVRRYEEAVTPLEVAQEISPGLAKSVIVAEIDGHPYDLTAPITKDAALRLFKPTDPEGLEVIRHDAAHLMAYAVQQLYPGTRVTIGPTIENGFYYDFDRSEPFTTDDLAKIEAKMHELAAKDEPITREEWERDEAIRYWKEHGEPYKVELIESFPEGEVISFYREGDFIDLCRGPHAPSTRWVRHFKLMKVAGAYWRGDARNPQLQRIYGTAWATEKDLKAYLHRLEEAERRDHRRLGREMDLFHIQEEAVGMVFWHDKGWTLFRTLEEYIRRKLEKAEYREVRTPVLVDRVLWEASGHWEKFREHMFTAESEERVLAMKPMNCPCHVQIFNQGVVSYRDLPIRMAEFGSCHRNEPSGALHGLMRVRGFTQDDAHIFCTEEQITAETIAFCALLREVYRDLGFTDVRVKFSDRPEVRAGDDAIWDKAESSLKAAMEEAGLETELNPGEGAFYGPKLEFVLRDAIGRDWQCGTLQVDFVLPERLGASYIGSDGGKHRPVMLHRAILGSFERFIGILIEEYAGKFPLWLAPLQVVVATITNEVDEYGEEVLAALRAAGIRAELDASSEKISYKVRLHSNRKAPVILAVGRQEAENRSVSVRRLGSKEQETVPLEDFVTALTEEARMPEA